MNFKETLAKRAGMVWKSSGSKDFWKNFADTVRELSNDRRYHVMVSASTAGYSPAGIFEYRGVRYYMYRNSADDSFSIEVAPKLL